MPISHLMSESFYLQQTGLGNSAAEDVFSTPSEVDSVDSHDNFQEIHQSSHSSSDVYLPTNRNQHQHELSGEEVRLEGQSERKVVLIDTDGGIDDAWALFMSLAGHKEAEHTNFHIAGITTVCGTYCVEYGMRNVNRVLTACKDDNIPVFKGMDSFLLGNLPKNRHIDGLSKDTGYVESEHAVNAIIRLAEAHKGELTMICLGPLTNLAMALKLKPQIRMMLKEVLVFGGNMDAVGNTTPCSEFNFFVDPEAVQVVLDNISPCPLVILPLETCMNFATSTMDWRHNVLGNMKTRNMSFLNKVESKVLKDNHECWAVCAAALIACVIDKNIIKKTEEFHCAIELHGTSTRGMLVVDRHFLQQRQSNATLITEINRELYESMLVWAAGGPNYKSLNSFEMHYW